MELVRLKFWVLRNNMKCLVCSTEFVAAKNLHSHLKAHKLSVQNYYAKYYPQKDMYDGKPIKFTNLETYFVTKFNSKSNMIKWMRSHPVKKVVALTRELLKIYKAETKSRYDSNLPPNQIDLRVKKLPSVVFLTEKCNLDFNEFLVSLGYKERFLYPRSPLFYDCSKKLLLSVDTREQIPLVFDNKEVKVLSQKLDYGDYVAMGENYNGIFIERKSLADLIATISMGYERFNKEVQRAKKMNGYVVVLVESSLNDALSFNFLPHISRNIKARPDFIFHRIRESMRVHSNLQYLFVKNRDEASQAVVKLCMGKEYVKKVDLQFCYDKGLI